MNMFDSKNDMLQVKLWRKIYYVTQK